jgi:hypothetical protein
LYAEEYILYIEVDWKALRMQKNSRELHGYLNQRVNKIVIQVDLPPAPKEWQRHPSRRRYDMVNK